MDTTAYQQLLDCISTNDINVCEQVPSGLGAKLVNPLGGGGHQVDGADRCVHASSYNTVKGCRRPMEAFHSPGVCRMDINQADIYHSDALNTP